MCPGGYPIQESQNWQSGFLPGVYQGTYIDTQHTDIEKLIENIRNRPRHAPTEQREQLDLLQQLNRAAPAHARQDDAAARSPHPVVRAGLPHADARRPTRSTSAASRSTSATCTAPASQARQTADRPPAARARRALRAGLARRRPAVGQPRRHRGRTTASSPASATRRSRALLTDLKQRGLLDDTLVIWGGEFGRTPTVELPTPGANAGKINGRDHNHYGFTMWLAGGGVKGGHVHGATDEFGFQAVENRVHVHDLHATILHLLGFDHEKLHLPLRRPRLPPHRRPRPRRPRDPGLNPAPLGSARLRTLRPVVNNDGADGFSVSTRTTSARECPTW